MAFQPIVERGSGAIYAQEALVRGLDGQGAGWVLEQVTSEHLYHFDQACRTRAIQLASELDLEQLLSINFMPNAVDKPERCLQTTLQVADDTGFPINRLIFEIVETEDDTDTAHLTEIIDVYRAFGMKVALDDVGSGRSGLDRVVDLETDILKVDRHVISGIDRDPRRQHTLAGLVAIARGLGSRLVAEGIETRTELLTVLSLGVELVQGFFIARPQFEGFADIAPEAWEILRTHEQTRRGPNALSGAFFA